LDSCSKDTKKSKITDYTKKQNDFQTYVNVTECLTETFCSPDPDAGTKPLNRDCPG